MAYVLSSISGNLISAASAGFAPTNSADVSAIASSYQVVSATATQLNAGTAYVTSINDTPISAARAGNAANASLANSAWYDGTGRLISSLPDEATVSGIASAYAESAASSKQDTLTFDWNAGSAISAINGSALAGQGGVAITAISYDTSTHETSVVTATGLGIANHTTNPRVSSFKFSDDSYRPIEASSLAAGATQTGKNGFVTYTLKLSPSASMWTTSDVATGIFYPLQWGTGAGVFMDAGNFKGHMKGNEIFVSNTAQKRAANLEVNHLGLSSNNGSSQANLRDYVLSIVDSANSTATLGRYWLSFSSTASGNAMYATNYINLYDTAESATKTISSTSIDYWNGKVDGSSLSSYALSADVSSVIDTVSSNSASWGQGGVDSATVSSIASSYAESAASSKLDTTAFNSGDFYSTGNESGFVDSAYVTGAITGKLDASASSSFYTTANESGFLTGLPIDISVRDLSASRHVRATDTSLDLYGNFDYAGMYFRLGSQRPYNIGIDNTGANFYVATAKNGFERIYASSIQSWNSYSAKQDALSFGYDDDKISAINGSALAGQGGDELVTAIGTSESGITSINNSGLVDTAALHSADYSSLYVQDPLYISAIGDSSYIGISGNVGGIDSATCSAIASAYAESAASSKLDESATADFYPTSNPSGYITGVDLTPYQLTADMSAYAYESSLSAKLDASASSDFYSTANPSGFLTGVDLSDYATTAYVDSSVSSKLDTTAFNSGDFYSTSNPSSFVDSAYVDSAVSSKADSSALTSYALSADVSGTVDLVSTQSANWGGSALALSAGPGVKFEKSGNVLVASTDETVLWSNTEGKLTKDLTFPLALSETIANFERVKFLYGGDSYVQNAHWIEFEATDNNPYTLYDFRCDGPSTTDIYWRLAKFNINGTAVTNTYNSTINLNTAFAGNGYNTSGYNYLVQIVGINRTAEA